MFGMEKDVYCNTKFNITHDNLNISAGGKSQQ
jgi:hypothetical protein